MLRRTKGRTLLTLLVITGLAGTINDTALTKKERKLALNLMKDSKTGFSKNIKGLSESQINYRPSPDEWSVKECIYHIARSESNLWDLLKKTMNAPANPEKRSEIQLSDDQIIKMTEDKCNKAWFGEACELKKISWKDAGAAVADFKNKRDAHAKYINSTTESLRNHVVKMPFGWIDCYQLSLMIAAHCSHYAQQIARIKSAPDFPKS